MATRKIYGHDGPPQLHGRVESVPLEEVPDYWGREAVANWHLSVPDWWGKRIRCKCGTVDAFEVLTGTSAARGWVRGKLGGHQRCDLRCTLCGERFVFFDDGIHGWNAVIADERATIPTNYLESNTQLLEPLVCECGGRTFSVIAEAIYDCGEGIDELPESQWDDAYGSFSGIAKCRSCGNLHQIADAETA